MMLLRNVGVGRAATRILVGMLLVSAVAWAAETEVNEIADGAVTGERTKRDGYVSSFSFLRTSYANYLFVSAYGINQSPVATSGLFLDSTSNKLSYYGLNLATAACSYMFNQPYISLTRLNNPYTYNTVAVQCYNR